MPIDNLTVDNLTRLICEEPRDPRAVRRALISFAHAVAAAASAPPAPSRSEGLNLEQVFEVVAWCWGVEVNDLRGKSRCKMFSEPRSAAIYLARLLLGDSATYVALGGELGGRDHTTIIHGYCQAMARMGLAPGSTANLSFRDKVALARTRLGFTETGAPAGGSDPRQTQLRLVAAS